MSFILDALRKAEHGRQNSPAATVTITPADVPAAPPNTRKRVLATTAIALLLVAAGVAFYSLRSGQPAAPVETARAPAPPPPVAAARQSVPPAQAPVTRPLRDEATPEAQSSRQDVRALDQEINRQDPARRTTAAAAAVTERPARRVTPGTVTVMSPEQMEVATGTAAADSATPVVSSDATNDTYAGLPEYRNLLRSGRINLPNLSLDMHVYNRDPEKRFVFVNLKKYREGDIIDGKAAVEAITTDGAVLNNNGVSFLLRPD